MLHINFKQDARQQRYAKKPFLYTPRPMLLNSVLIHLSIPFERIMGIIAGLQTQPALLGYASEQTRNDEPNLGYTTVYPAATILKIILAQIILTSF